VDARTPIDPGVRDTVIEQDAPRAKVGHVEVSAVSLPCAEEGNASDCTVTGTVPMFVRVTCRDWGPLSGYKRPKSSGVAETANWTTLKMTGVVAESVSPYGEE